MDKKVYEFISKQMNDPIVERRTCRRTGEPFPVFQSEISLLDTISPVIQGEKMQLAMPTLSPQSRMRRRMMFRNERKLYKRKCNLSGKDIVSIYPAEYPGPVYQPLQWHGDGWDPASFGKPYTAGRFYEDFKEVLASVPKLSMFILNNENSDYTNGSQQNKNCYMIFASDHNENCLYDYSTFHSIYALDSYGATGCNNVYESIDCIDSGKTFFSQRIEKSFDVRYSSDLKNCTSCFLCFGLKDRQYCLRNEVIGKERWDQEVTPLIQKVKKDPVLHKAMLDEMDSKKKEIIVQNMNILNSHNAYGDLIMNSKNISGSFELSDGENISNVVNCNGLCKDVMGGYVVVDGSQKVFEGISIVKTYQTITNFGAWDNSKYTYFSSFTVDTTNVIGCCGLRKKDYCILSRQYTREEREKNTIEIIKELQQKGRRGEFLGAEFSPFPYNDTVADEYYPIHKMIINGQEKIINPEGKGTVTLLQPDKFISDAILDLGGEEKLNITWRTKETEINIPEGIATIQAKDLPTDINEVADDILNKAIICEISGRPFKVVEPELAFYRRHGLPLPHKHPDIRHGERFAKRPGREFYLRNCDKCGVEMLSVHDAKSEFKVYCESCYNKEVYG